MTFRFTIEVKSALPGRLVYSSGDMAFDFYPESDIEEASPGTAAGTTSFVGELIQLEVAVGDGRILYPWGYCPRSAWTASRVSLPRASEGALVAELSSGELTPGISESLVPDLSAVHFDAGTGVVHLASGFDAQQVALIATGVYVGTAHGNLTDLWMVPDFVD